MGNKMSNAIMAICAKAIKGMVSTLSKPNVTDVFISDDAAS